MSYLAIIGILFLYPKIRSRLPKKLTKSKIISFLILSFSIQIILTPIFLYYFKTLPLLSFIPNLVIIPLGSILVQVLFVGLLLSFINMSFLVTPLGYYLYKLLDFIVSKLSEIPYLTINIDMEISLLLYVVLYAIIFLWVVIPEKNNLN
jgi:competence protein ComEC